MNAPHKRDKTDDQGRPRPEESDASGATSARNLNFIEQISCIAIFWQLLR